MESSTQQPAVETAITADVGAEIEAPSSVFSEPMSSLTIKGQGLMFEREIPESLVLQIMQLALTGKIAGSNRTGGGDRDDGERRLETPGAGGRKESLVEFYKRAGPKSYPEKLATIAKYLHDVLNKISFTPEELRAQFRSVNEPPPANLPRDMRTAQGQGLIAEEHDMPGQYYITRTGMDAVDAGFGAEGRKSKSRKRKRTARAAETEVAEGAEDGEE